MALKVRVLVVERDAEVIRQVKALLGQMEIEAVCLANAWEAAERVQREKFDGVFLDWNLPDLNGEELTRRVRTSPSNSRIPIGVLAHHQHSPLMLTASRAGATYVLTKPIDPEEFRRLMVLSRAVMLEEHRRYCRAPLAVPVVCEWEDGRASGHTIDVSSTGLLMRLDKRPERGIPVWVDFSLPPPTGRIKVEALVARTCGRREVAVRFVDLSRSWLESLLQYAEQTSFPAPATVPGLSLPGQVPASNRIPWLVSNRSRLQDENQKGLRLAVPPEEVRVLVVDKDRQTRALVASVLERKDWKIVQAGSQREGMKCLCRSDWHLVVVGLSSPSLRGPLHEVLLELAGVEKAFRVLFLAERLPDWPVQHLLDSLAIPCLSKPLQLPDLLYQVSELLLQAGVVRAPLREIPLREIHPDRASEAWPVDQSGNEFPRYEMFASREEYLYYYYYYDEDAEDGELSGDELPPPTLGF